MSNCYSLVFKGETAPGTPLDDVKKKLSASLGISHAQADRLFAGGTFVKKNLDSERATRYRKAFADAGAICSLVPENGQAKTPEPPKPISNHLAQAAPDRTAEAPAISPAPPAERMTCPKCGTEQPPAEECSSCGVLVRKFAKAAQRALDPEKIAGEVVARYRERFQSSRILFGPDFPANDIQQALDAYRTDSTVWHENQPIHVQDDEEVLIVVKNSIFSDNAKSNLLLTNRKLLHCLSMGAQICAGWEWGEINSVGLKGRNRDNLFINGKEIVLAGAEDGAAQTRTDLAKMIREIMQSFKVRSRIQGPTAAIEQLAPPPASLRPVTANNPAIPPIPASVAASPALGTSGGGSVHTEPTKTTPANGDSFDPATQGQLYEGPMISTPERSAEKESGGFFAPEKKGLEKGMAGGIAMMVIAAVWFILGYRAGYIFFYPPILFVIGLFGFIKGLFGQNV